MTEKICKKCGAKLNEDAEFCPDCKESAALTGANPEKSGGVQADAERADPADTREASPADASFIPSEAEPDERPALWPQPDFPAKDADEIHMEPSPEPEKPEPAAKKRNRKEQKAPQKRGAAANFFAGVGSILITLILLVSVLATVCVQLVRFAASHDEIRRIAMAADADAIYVDAITGEDVRLRTTLCDLISYNIPSIFQNAYGLDADMISQLADANCVRTFIADKLCGYSDSLFKGADTGRLDEAELIAFLTENKAELDPIFKEPLRSDDIQSLADLIMKGGFAEMTDLEAAKARNPLPFSIIRWSFSDAAQIVRLIFCVFLWLLLFFINQKRAGTACLYSGIALLFPGLALTLCGLLKNMIASFIQIVFPIGPNFLRLALDGVCRVSLELGIILLGTAVLFIILHSGAKALRDRRKTESNL